MSHGSDFVRIIAERSHGEKFTSVACKLPHIVALNREEPGANWWASLWSSCTCHRRRPRMYPPRKLYVPQLLSIHSPLPEVRTSWQVKDVSNEKSHPESLRESPWHGGRLHWLETGCTSNFCNEIPQTPPTAIQNGGEGRGWTEEVGRDGSREFSERLYRERSASKNVSLRRND